MKGNNTTIHFNNHVAFTSLWIIPYESTAGKVSFELRLHYRVLPSHFRVYSKYITPPQLPFQAHPTSIFGKYLFGRKFEIYNFRNICFKISCLPASPRIFEGLKNGIIAHFYRKKVT